MGGSGQHADRRAAAVRSARALLGVPADADVPELTRAYWRHARALHPDRNADPAATEQFQALHTAYRLSVDALLQGRPAAVPPPTPDSPREARPTTIAVTRRPTGPTNDDGIWVMAGPAHVRPPRRDATTRDRAGGDA